VTVAHWDDVESHHRATGEMDATWQLLGEAAGTRGVGMNRVRVEPGKLPTPPHSHLASEELYFVLAGSGLAWQDGQVHEVRPLDCFIQRSRRHEHTFVAGPAGLEFLVFGTRHPAELGWLPRSRALRVGRTWIEGRDDDPWDVEATVSPLTLGEPAARPQNLVNVDEVEHERWGDRGTTAPLATRERSTLAGLHWETIDAGRRGCVPHCHSSEEEVFVILDGSATLELWPPEGEVEETAIHAGHVVSRPAGTRVAHSFRAGPNGVTMLTYGTREANDICWYPRSQKIFLRGVGVIGRIERLDYFDGEPVEDD
jgi:uncharacterized cupin superfamily protein